MTFTGNTDIGVDGVNSLLDGVYDLNITAAKVHPSGVPGVSMAADQTTTFHRLFGDTGAASTPPGGTPGVDFQAIVNTGDNLSSAARSTTRRPTKPSSTSTATASSTPATTFNSAIGSTRC